MGIEEGLIQEIVRRVLSAAKADRIILFGSAAIGNMNRDSDIDLLVLEELPSNRREERLRIAKALRGLGFGFDVFVMGTERFEESKEIFGGLAYPAHKFGRVIYESCAICGLVPAARIAARKAGMVARWSPRK